MYVLLLVDVYLVVSWCIHVRELEYVWRSGLWSRTRECLKISGRYVKTRVLVCQEESFGMSGGELGYVWRRTGVCMEENWDMSGGELGYVWSRTRECLEIIGVCQEENYGMSRGELGYVWRRNGICLQYVKMKIAVFQVEN